MGQGQRCMGLDSKCPELEHIHLPSSWTIPKAGPMNTRYTGMGFPPGWFPAGENTALSGGVSW